MTTLAEAQAMVTAYLSAEQAILQGKEVGPAARGLGGAAAARVCIIPFAQSPDHLAPCV